MSAEKVAASVETLIRARFHVASDDAWFSRKTNLWEQGYVDSIGVVEVISHIETTFDVEVPDEALFDPSFTSIDGIATVISALLSSTTRS